MIAYWIKKRFRETAETLGLGVLLPKKQPLIAPAKGQVTIEFTSWKPLRAMAFKPSLALGEALAMFDERFCRLWEFNLVGCELAFSHSNLVVYQLQLTKSKGIVPITRDYLYS